MRTRTRLLLIVSLVVFVVLLLLFRRRPIGNGLAEEQVATAETVVTQANIPWRPALPRQTEPDISKIDLQKLDQERQRLVEGGKDQWRTPIEFYGKVVDENGQPVEGAQIKFSCNDLSPKGTSYYQRVSDVRGLFSITDIRGKLLTASVSKLGYYTSRQDNDSFFYAGKNQNFVPDFNNPIIFHLRKTSKAEPLLPCDFPGFARIAQLRRDGTPTEINLATCSSVAGGGHLKLEFWGDKIERGTRKFNWKLRVSVPNGGLIETEEEFNFEAPETGYKPAIEINMPMDDEKWRTDFQRKFFIRLPDGKYGRIEFTLLARNGVFTIGSAINSSDSRNLEFDPAVQPKQTQFE